MTEVMPTENPLLRRKIDEYTKEWASDLDTVLPISGSDIPHFQSWINWNGFHLDRETGKGHDGFDFAAYLTTDGKVVLGLPPETQIRAAADGVVAQVLDNPEAVGGGYGVMINLEHGAHDSGMFSKYIHVVPQVEQRQNVKKGEVIGTLYKDPDASVGRLVHLHFGLTSGWGTRGTSISGGGLEKRIDDPGLIVDPGIYSLSAEPQGNKDFKVPLLPEAKIEGANFKAIRVNE